MEIIVKNRLFGRMNTIEERFNLNWKWLEPDLLREYLNILSDVLRGGRVHEVTAIIKDLADEVLEIVQKFMKWNGLDQRQIPNKDVKCPNGTIYLTEGEVRNISNLKRCSGRDVTINYMVPIKKVTITIPIQYDILVIEYRYYSRMCLLTASGVLQIILMNIKANIVVSYSFEDSVISLDEFDIIDRGQLRATFSGKGYLDGIFRRSSTAQMHSEVIDEIQKTVKKELEEVFEKVSKILKFTSRFLCEVIGDENN